MKKTIINNVDCSGYFVSNVSIIAYLDVTGGNSGTMLDGTETVDLIRRKARFTRICKPLTDEQMLTLFGILRKKEHPEVEFYDPELGTYRSAKMLYSTSEIRQLDRLSGDDYWTSLELTFTEK